MGVTESVVKLEKKLPAVFYRSPSGREPVRDWIKDLDAIDQKLIGRDIATLEFCWPLAQPKCKPVKGRKWLWEIRSSVSDKRIVRVFFCLHEGKMVLLHGFIKKTRKAPETDLDLAVTRMKEVKKHD